MVSSFQSTVQQAARSFDEGDDPTVEQLLNDAIPQSPYMKGVIDAAKLIFADCQTIESSSPVRGRFVRTWLTLAELEAPDPARLKAVVAALLASARRTILPVGEWLLLVQGAHHLDTTFGIYNVDDAPLDFDLARDVQLVPDLRDALQAHIEQVHDICIQSVLGGLAQTYYHLFHEYQLQPNTQYLLLHWAVVLTKAEQFADFDCPTHPLLWHQSFLDYYLTSFRQRRRRWVNLQAFVIDAEDATAPDDFHGWFCDYQQEVGYLTELDSRAYADYVSPIEELNAAINDLYNSITLGNPSATLEACKHLLLVARQDPLPEHLHRWLEIHILSPLQKFVTDAVGEVSDFWRLPLGNPATSEQWKQQRLTFLALQQAEVMTRNGWFDFVRNVEALPNQSTRLAENLFAPFIIILRNLKATDVQDETALTDFYDSFAVLPRCSLLDSIDQYIANKQKAIRREELLLDYEYRWQETASFEQAYTLQQQIEADNPEPHWPERVVFLERFKHFTAFDDAWNNARWTDAQEALHALEPLQKTSTPLNTFLRQLMTILLNARRSIFELRIDLRGATISSASPDSEEIEILASQIELTLQDLVEISEQLGLAGTRFSHWSTQFLECQELSQVPVKGDAYRRLGDLVQTTRYEKNPLAAYYSLRFENIRPPLAHVIRKRAKAIISAIVIAFITMAVAFILVNFVFLNHGGSVDATTIPDPGIGDAQATDPAVTGDVPFGLDNAATPADENAELEMNDSATPADENAELETHDAIAPADENAELEMNDSAAPADEVEPDSEQPLEETPDEEILYASGNVFYTSEDTFFYRYAAVDGRNEEMPIPCGTELVVWQSRPDLQTHVSRWVHLKNNNTGDSGWVPTSSVAQLAADCP